MTVEVAIYILILIAFNLGGPMLFYRKSGKWEMAFIACGLLWFMEAFFIATWIHMGVKYDPMIEAFSLTMYVPIPFIVGGIGLITNIYKKWRGNEEMVEEPEYN